MTDRFEKDAENILPCVHQLACRVAAGEELHSDWCPAFYRPIVAVARRAEYKRTMERCEAICRDPEIAPHSVGSYFGGDTIPIIARNHLANAIRAEMDRELGIVELKEEDRVKP